MKAPPDPETRRATFLAEGSPVVASEKRPRKCIIPADLQAFVLLWAWALPLLALLLLAALL